MLPPGEFAEAFSVACDAVCRSVFADRYGIRPDDGVRHTSTEARRITKAVFDAVGIWVARDYDEGQH